MKEKILSLLRGNARLSAAEIAAELTLSPDTVAAEIAARDKQDSERAVAPLKQAADAIAVDNSDWTIEQTLDYICSQIETIDAKA